MRNRVKHVVTCFTAGRTPCALPKSTRAKGVTMTGARWVVLPLSKPAAAASANTHRRNSSHAERAIFRTCSMGSRILPTYLRYYFDIRGITTHRCSLLRQLFCACVRINPFNRRCTSVEMHRLTTLLPFDAEAAEVVAAINAPWRPILRRIVRRRPIERPTVSLVAHRRRLLIKQIAGADC